MHGRVPPQDDELREAVRVRPGGGGPHGTRHAGRAGWAGENQAARAKLGCWARGAEGAQKSVNQRQARASDTLHSLRWSSTQPAGRRLTRRVAGRAGALRHRRLLRLAGHARAVAERGVHGAAGLRGAARQGLCSARPCAHRVSLTVSPSPSPSLCLHARAVEEHREVAPLK